MGPIHRRRDWAGSEIFGLEIFARKSFSAPLRRWAAKKQGGAATRLGMKNLPKAVFEHKMSTGVDRLKFYSSSWLPHVIWFLYGNIILQALYSFGTGH